MQGPVEWPTLLLIVSAIVTTFLISGGVVYRAFDWVYKDSINTRAMIDTIRVETAKTYATIEAQKLIKEAVEQRGQHLEKAVENLSNAVDRMSEKQDRSIHDLIKALAQKLTSDVP